MIRPELLKHYHATHKTILAGEYIFSEGSECSYYHELISGRIKWTNIHEDGREFIHNIILPGDSFGELPLFDELPYAASAIADSNCTIIRLSKESFLKCMNEHPEIHFSFTQLFVKRLRFQFMLLQEMAQCEPEHRIFRLLEYLQMNSGNICKLCNVVKLTRQEIANMTGLRVETVIRTIKHMAQEKKVTIIKGKVYMPGYASNNISTCSSRKEEPFVNEEFQKENTITEIL